MTTTSKSPLTIPERATEIRKHLRSLEALPSADYSGRLKFCALISWHLREITGNPLVIPNPAPIDFPKTNQ